MTQAVPSAGAILDGRYRVDSVLGEGAHGVVLAVTRLSDGVRFALKRLDSVAGDAQRLDREARVLERLDHPGIVRFHDAGRLPGGDRYVVIELIVGPTLARALADGGPLAPAEAKSVMLDVARALACAHDAGVVHRDLHPGNVMLVGDAPDRAAKVLDFGVAAFAEDARLTPSGAAPGTVAYMAPEQLAGQTVPQSDLYAWGLLFIECLLGRPVVTGKSFYEVAFKQLRDDAVAIPSALLAHPLGRLIARALAKRLADRVASAAELAAELAGIDVAGLSLSSDSAVTLRGPDLAPSSAPLSPLGSGLERRHVTLLVVAPDDAPPVVLHDWVRDVLRPRGGLAEVDPDGSVVALFGVPIAHEDDAARAAHVALVLAASSVPGGSAPRAGLASGVLVADPRAGVSTLASARATPIHLRASRLARAAAIGAVLADDSTERLIRGRFVCEPASRAEGDGASLAAHRVIRPHAVPARLATGAIVGREREIAALLRLWGDARAGRSKAAIVVGEAGIGKSRLLQALGEACRAGGGRWVDCGCSPHASNTPLFPLLERARAQAGLAFGDDPEEARRKLVASGVAAALGGPGEVALLAELLVDRSPGPTDALEARVDALVSLLTTRTGAPPMLITIEDASWCDPTTLELLGAAVERPGARLLVVLAARAEIALPAGLRGADEIAVGRLSPAQGAELARAASLPGSISDDAVDRVVAAADGVPLFVEELTRALRPPGAEPALASIPSTVRGLLCARLDALGGAKRTAQLAAIAGHEVRLDLLVAVAPWGEEALGRDLDAMIRLGLVYQRGVPPSSSYQFAHHLLREVALDSMLPEVRSAWHGTLADALVARFGAQAEAHPESLARHYAEAGRPLEAATWAERASRQAFARSAPVEAVRLLRFASGELSGVPASDRRGDLEIGVQRGLVSALVATRGMASPDTEAALSRMHALHVARGEAAHAFLVARMIGTQAASRAEYGRALADADRALADPICATSPRLEALARAQRGMALFAGARFVEARADLDRSIALFDWLPPAGPDAPVAVDPRLFAGGFAARVLWHLGMPDRAVARADDGLRIARAMGFAHAEILAQSALAFVHYERRDPCATERALEGLEARAGARALPSLVGLVAVGRAWVEAQRGEDRTASTSEAIARYCDNGIRFELSQLHAIAADACLAVGQVDRGLSFVADGLAFAAQSGELHAEPELYRLRAALVDQARGVGSEEARDALEIAASLAAVSGARSLALRIACDLARWHLAQGDGAAARDALAPELALIVEGEGTIDVLDARSLAGLLAADVA